eukprot:GHVU01126602.1.p1 GENE.GHVU01126602.1~~GHVU01126602.1.p1  ORF type:complete len:498 (+),score=85.82 GHVU01126602.1:76-1494(+)
MAAAAALGPVLKSNTVWRNKLQNKVKDLYGRYSAIFVIGETRWNSAQACFASILRVRKAVEFVLLEASSRRDTRADARDRPPAALITSYDLGTDFWTGLQRTEQILRPLSVASLVFQRENNTLSDIIYVYGRVASALADFECQYLDKLEKRWSNEEQLLLVIAAVLDPRRRVDFCSRIRTAAVASIGDLTYGVMFYYKTFVGDEYAGIEAAFLSWYEGRVEEATVVSSDAVWPLLRRGDDAGLRKLAVLAMKVLSFPIQTATVERLFSGFGLTHTKQRNRLGAAKLHHLANIKENVKAEQERCEIRQPRRRKGPVSPVELAVAASWPGAGQQRVQTTAEEVHWDDVEVVQQLPDEDQDDEEDVGAAGVAQLERCLAAMNAVPDSDEEDECDEVADIGGDASFAREVLARSYSTGEGVRRANPLPQENDRRFPADKTPTKLRGLRAWKCSLISLFPRHNPVLDMMLDIEEEDM